MTDKKNHNNEIIKKVQKDELKENNSFCDITGNMNVWRVHETYEGSGNENIWEEIIVQNSKSELIRFKKFR